MLPTTPRVTRRANHVANLLAVPARRERSQGVLALKDYEQAPYLVLATRTAWSRRQR